MGRGERLARLCRLYGIVDDGPDFPLPLLQWATALARGGAAVVQLRFKRTQPGEALAIARKVRGLLPTQLLIVNDRPDLAVLADADGVHLGDEDLAPNDARRVVGPDRLVGVTARNIEAARAALNLGADYLGVGPIFPTRGKVLTVEPLGTERLAAICHAVAPAPVVGIAGIDASNLPSVIAAGARAAAVISAIGRAEDPERAARELAALARRS
jgi:thiamine-phosphate pyrophosphorylase